MIDFPRDSPSERNEAIQGVAWRAIMPFLTTVQLLRASITGVTVEPYCRRCRHRLSALYAPPRRTALRVGRKTVGCHGKVSRRSRDLVLLGGLGEPILWLWSQALPRLHLFGSREYLNSESLNGSLVTRRAVRFCRLRFCICFAKRHCIAFRS
jgi:hypothetical protein